MRILIAHSRYRSGPVSGENQVVADEARLLSEAGHAVETWAPSLDAKSVASTVRAGLDAIWSRPALADLRRIVAVHSPEVVHFHNLFPMLSPAVLRAAHRAGAAVVMTLHNYRLMCLPATFRRGGRPCEACLGRLPWRGVVYRCYRGSAPASLSYASSLALHRALGSFRDVALYLAVSDFVRKKHIEAGMSPARVIVKRNFAWKSTVRRGPGTHFLFAGRLEPEKGVDYLLRAWREVPAPLIVAGDGSERARLESLAPPSATFVGPIQPAEVRALLREARAMLIPSLWEEPAGRAIVEAYASGVPVIASRTGGLPEHVEDGNTGLLVSPGDATAWAGAARRLLDDSESSRMGRGAHAAWTSRYSSEKALEQLEGAYSRALDQRPEKRRNK